MTTLADLHARRRAETEARLVTAATELFLAQGYTNSTLRAVAESAGVSERTAFVRFGTKARLFQRVIEVGIVGDTGDLAMPERQWSMRALTAPTLEERIRAYADGVTEMLSRLGPLMAVNGEAEGFEPTIKESAQAAREATLAYLTRFWTALRDDGLVPATIDLDWVIDTTTVLSSAESRLLITRTLGWDDDQFRAWLMRSWEHFARGD